MIDAHTDRVGPPGANQHLSERRGGYVADELVKLGVPRSKLTVVGHGERSPAVPTRDGLPEPLNRRATISIVFAGQ